MKTVKYGLRHKHYGTLMSVYVSSMNDDTSYELTNDEDQPHWTADSAEHAEYVRLHDTPWYNAGVHTPMNHYNSDDLEVVQVVTETIPIKTASIPTTEEYLNWKYGPDGPEPNAAHLAHCLKMDKLTLTLYDVMGYVEAHKGV